MVVEEHVFARTTTTAITVLFWPEIVAVSGIVDIVGVDDVA